MTVREYRALTRWQRLLYRLPRHPLIANVLLPPLVFVLLYRVPFDTPRVWMRERWSVHFTNIALILLFTALAVSFGWQRVLAVHLPIMIVASILGVWLFSVQHRFETARWTAKNDWSFVDAALQGSSWFGLPRALHWLTGNIGFHHVHHLNPRVRELSTASRPRRGAGAASVASVEPDGGPARAVAHPVGRGRRRGWCAFATSTACLRHSEMQYLGALRGEGTLVGSDGQSFGHVDYDIDGFVSHQGSRGLRRIADAPRGARPRLRTHRPRLADRGRLIARAALQWKTIGQRQWSRSRRYNRWPATTAEMATSLDVRGKNGAQGPGRTIDTAVFKCFLVAGSQERSNWQSENWWLLSLWMAKARADKVTSCGSSIRPVSYCRRRHRGRHVAMAITLDRTAVVRANGALKDAFNGLHRFLVNESPTPKTNR